MEYTLVMEVGSDDMRALEAQAEVVADLLSLMANPKRLLVLCYLADGEKTVGAMQASLGLSQSALSQHLAKLRAGGVVTTRREAQSIYYSIADDQTRSIMSALYETFCAKT